MFSGFELGRTVFTGAPLTGLCCRPEVGCPPNGCAAAAPNASRNASSGEGGGCVSDVHAPPFETRRRVHTAVRRAGGHLGAGGQAPR